MLVVDGNGYIHLVGPSECWKYPIRSAQYCAFNNYVGEYSDYPKNNHEYERLLYGFLNYIKDGHEINVEEIQIDKSINDMLDEIGEVIFDKVEKTNAKSY